ncbi:MAG: response regulator [Flavobacteriales bacterium]|nr:response regulator [Flavobacteriales bacterium]
MTGQISRAVVFAEKRLFFRLVWLIACGGKLLATFLMNFQGDVHVPVWLDLALFSIAVILVLGSFVVPLSTRFRKASLQVMAFLLMTATIHGIYYTQLYWPTLIGPTILVISSFLVFPSWRASVPFWIFTLLLEAVVLYFSQEVDQAYWSQVAGMLPTFTLFAMVVSVLAYISIRGVHENEAFLQRILNETRDAIFLAELDHTIVMANDRFYELFEADESQQLEITSLMHTAPSQLTIQEVHEQMRRHGNAQGLFLFRSLKDNRSFYCEFSGQIIKMDREYILGRLTDIDEEMKNQQRLQTVLESSKDGVMLLKALRNAKGFVVDFEWEMLNEAARGIIEIQDKDVVGMKLSDTMNAHLWDRLFPIYVEVMDSGIPQDYENRTDYVGAEKWYHTICSRLDDSLMLTVRDYTTMKKTEQELVRAKEAAEAGARSKSDFLATMSHEIRTPMNAVMGMASLLAETPLTEDQHKFVKTIRIGADNLLTIINDILDYSKIESGKLELEFQSFNLRQMIEEVMDLMAPQVYNKGIELMYFIHPKVARHVVSDVTRLRQILINLINNAVKFTHEGEVFVEVQVNNDYELEFAVRDSGIGIPEDRMGRLFKTFSQVDSSTTRQYGGTGLGLAICKRLTELMGGEIHVKSEVGVGSVFTFTVEYRPLITAPQAEAEVLHPFSTKRAFIVDDNETNREILSRLLEQWNVHAVEFSSGKDLLEALDEAAADVYILDMHMPGMDGVQLATHIREEKGAQVPVMLLSSVMTSEIDKGQKELFNSIINKPLKHVDLYNELKSVFSEAIIIKSAPSVTPDFNIQRFEGVRVLVAEDNAINQQVAIHLFRRLGCSCDVVANGLEALEMLRLKSYDLVFMDVQMPEMDGIEATHLAHEEFGADCPVIIAMTANAMKGDREKFLETGMDDYISKPVCLEDLSHMVARYCMTTSD